MGDPDQGCRCRNDFSHGGGGLAKIHFENGARASQSKFQKFYVARACSEYFGESSLSKLKSTLKLVVPNSWIFSHFILAISLRQGSGGAIPRKFFTILIALR